MELSSSDVSQVKWFNPHGDPSNVGIAWQRWLRSFELYAVGRGVKNAEQKRALLLHCAGTEVQDIFFSLEEEEGSDAYEKSKKTLSKHFQPKINVPYERYCFRSMAQEDGESIEQFIVRLRQRAVRCNFQNADEEIRDQVIEKCRSHKIRAKLLIKGHDLKLDDLRTIAVTVELTDKQTKQMDAGAHGPQCGSNTHGASANIFTNPSVNHWCSVPEIRTQCGAWGLDEAQCDQKIIDVAVPTLSGKGNDNCRRYNWTGVEVTINTTRGELNQTIIDCNAGWDFDHSVYKSTIKEQFSVVCDQALLNELPLTIFGAVGMVGVVVFGAIGDRFGRRPAFIICLITQTLTGLVASFSPSFTVYFVVRTFTGFVNGSVFYCSFVLLMEMIGPSKRNLVRVSLMCIGAVCMMSLAGFSYFIRWWRGMSIAMAITAIVLDFFIPFIPESPAWQLTVGKIDQAEKTIRKMARVNKAELPEKLFTDEDIAELKGIKQASMIDLLKSPILRYRQLIICWMSFCIALASYGMTLNSGNIGTDDHLSFVLLIVVEIPGFVLVYLLLDRIGRKWTMMASFVISGAGCFVTAFVEQGSVAQTAVAMVGKFGIAGALSVSDLYVTELLPTQVRNVGMGLNGMGFGLGVTLAPYITRIQDFWPPATMLIFGILTILAAIPVFLFLPETMGRDLPATIEEGENFTKRPGKGSEKDLPTSGVDMAVDVQVNMKGFKQSGIDNVEVEYQEEENVHL
ncbi:organic cation transporter 1-like [Patiria miniata]|uniref:Major facilitator superfamily (MFS) profile domain-containing protein n=1 Tax=Patiria miniata TaxID=46514 RepID=A0A913ZS86_PATMI|nr:organic cation transporter 1-like [Patiria miniata]